MGGAATILEAREVTKRYDGVVALSGVSLSVTRGSCTALVGESGSGKTTLLRSFNRMVEPESGSLHVSGADVATVDPIALRRSIGYVSQEGGLLPHWTVARNVELVPWLLGDPDRLAAATRALELVGLPPTTFRDRWPRELSGGQRQRAALARALAASPTILLLDEPFGALDAITRTDVQSVLARLQRELDLTTLLVTHDLREAFALSDRIVVMRGGRVEQSGAPAVIRSHPATDYVSELLTRADIA